jgi:hypothetical protein
VRWWLESKGALEAPRFDLDRGFVLSKVQLDLLQAFDVPYRIRRLRSLVQVVNGGYQDADINQRHAIDQFKERLADIAFDYEEALRDTHDVDEALFLSDRVFVFTEAPVQKLEEVIVPLKRPREIRDIHKPEVIAVKELLIDQLRKQVKI